MTFIDSHCHLNYKGLVEDQQGALDRARAAGVSMMLNISTRASEWDEVIGLAEREADVMASVGIHPHEADIHPDVEASAQLGSFDLFKRHPEYPSTFIAFTGIDNTRFRGLVEPPCRLYFVGRALRNRISRGKVIFSYQFQGLVEGKVVYETEVTGMQL